MVGVVRSIPTGGIFIFAETLKSCCQFCTEMPPMSDLCYLGKTRLIYLDPSAPLNPFRFSNIRSSHVLPKKEFGGVIVSGIFAESVLSGEALATESQRQ